MRLDKHLETSEMLTKQALKPDLDLVAFVQVSIQFYFIYNGRFSLKNNLKSKIFLLNVFHHASFQSVAAAHVLQMCLTNLSTSRPCESYVVTLGKPHYANGYHIDEIPY